MKWGLILGMTLAIFLAACSTKIVCDKPYILVGQECCLDQNDDLICDKDKPVEVAPPAQPIEEPPALNNSERFLRVKIYYGDERGEEISKVFAGEQETGYYYLWLKNVGDYDALCSVWTNEADSKSDSNIKPKFKTQVLKGETFSRPVSVSAPLYLLSFTEDKMISDYVVCTDLAMNQSIKTLLSLQKNYWYLHDQGGNSLNNEVKITIGEGRNITKDKVKHEIIVKGNDQKDTCTFSIDGEVFNASMRRTQNIRGVFTTLTAVDFYTCTALFW